MSSEVRREVFSAIEFDPVEEEEGKSLAGHSTSVSQNKDKNRRKGFQISGTESRMNVCIIPEGNFPPE